MSLRDLFAGQVISGLIITADFDRYDGQVLISKLADTADAILEARYRQ